jgi:hypothetical protein
MMTLGKAFALSTLSVFLWASSALAVTLSFSDNAEYWPNWNNGSNDDNRDVISAPNFTGGVVELNSGGYLKRITVNQKSAADWYSVLAAGDLLIDRNASQVWNYMVDLSSWTVSSHVNPNPGAGFYRIWAINLPLGSAGSNPGYTLSGTDASSEWPQYNIRDNHPVAVAESVVRTDTGKDVYFSGWNDSSTESWTFTFDESAIFLGDRFTIAWGVNCANDVIYGTCSVPAPATLLLLCSGLLGLAGMVRRSRK